MKTIALTFAAFFVLVLCLAFTMGRFSVLSQPRPTPTPNILVHETVLPSVELNQGLILNLVNNYRDTKHVPWVRFAQHLCDTAAIRLQEVRTNWSHDGFSATRFCPTDRKCDIGENLAKNFNSETDLVNAWIASPTHEEQMASPLYSYACVVSYGDYTVLHLSNLK